MITSILSIVASIAGLAASWALMKFIVIPWYQKYQNMIDTVLNNKTKQDAADANQKQNNQDQVDAAKRGDIWKKLDPPK